MCIYVIGVHVALGLYVGGPLSHVSILTKENMKRNSAVGTIVEVLHFVFMAFIHDIADGMVYPYQISTS